MFLPTTNNNFKHFLKERIVKKYCTDAIDSLWADWEYVPPIVFSTLLKGNLQISMIHCTVYLCKIYVNIEIIDKNQENENELDYEELSRIENIRIEVFIENLWFKLKQQTGIIKILVEIALISFFTFANNKCCNLVFDLS